MAHIIVSDEQAAIIASSTEDIEIRDRHGKHLGYVAYEAPREAISSAVVTSVTSESEAAMIVTALAEQGIESIASGGYTAGFRAEAPGEVQVIVRQRDLQRAREVLAVFETENAAIDWSQVDVGEPVDD